MEGEIARFLVVGPDDKCLSTGKTGEFSNRGSVVVDDDSPPPPPDSAITIIGSIRVNRVRAS